MIDFFEKREVPIFIAELGAKYADMEILTGMVKQAKAAGANMVKFQTYEAETISTPGSIFTMEDGSKVSQFDFFKAYELSKADHDILIAVCKIEGIEWFSTPSHPRDVKLLEELGTKYYKLGSDDLTNTPFIKHISSFQKPLLLSTGMCVLGEIEKAIDAFFTTGNKQLVLLHCVVSYPAKPEDANLRVIETLKKAFGLPVGLSDHTQGEFTSILAAQMGVCLIEKHFTPDHAMKLPDHQASLDPEQFKKMTDSVKLVNCTLGDGVKRILKTEEKWRKSARKSIFTTRAIKKGEIITADDLCMRRPSDGIHPHYFDLIIGRAAVRDIEENALLTWDMV